jgi:hypothetical protein
MVPSTDPIGDQAMGRALKTTLARARVERD